MMMPEMTTTVALCAGALRQMEYTFAGQTVNGLDAARGIIATRGENKGRLRASKPKLVETVIARERYGFTSDYRDISLESGATAQVWRLVAFMMVQYAPYVCMPVTVDFDRPFDMSHEESRKFAGWCEDIATLIVAVASKRGAPTAGLGRWAHALGL